MDIRFVCRRKAERLTFADVVEGRSDGQLVGASNGRIRLLQALHLDADDFQRVVPASESLRERSTSAYEEGRGDEPTHSSDRGSEDLVFVAELGPNGKTTSTTDQILGVASDTDPVVE